MSVEYGSNRPNLDARLVGMVPDGETGSKMTAVAETTTTFYFTFPFDCKFNGIDMYAWSSHSGDTMELSTEYNAGPYGWKRYKKFGKDWNVFPDTKERIVLFPTEPKSGVRIKLVYNNVGLTDVNFVVNLFTFVDQIKIDTGSLEEGEDW